MNVQEAFARYQRAVRSAKSALKKVEDCSQALTPTNWAVTGKTVYDLEQSVARLRIALTFLQMAKQNGKGPNNDRQYATRD